MAAAIDLNRDVDRRYLGNVLSASKNAGAKAWSYYDGLGEVHYAINRSARVAGYADLYCYLVDDAGREQDIVTDGLPADIVQGIYSRNGGVRGLIDRWYGQMKVPADSYLIRVRDGDGDPDGYEFLSAEEVYGPTADELSTGRLGDQQLLWVTLPKRMSGGLDKPFGHEIARRDFLGRVWVPSRRWIDLQDSALAALEQECEMLLTLIKSMKARLMQRFAMAGMFLLPDGIKEVKISGVADNGRLRMEDAMTYLQKAFTANISNWERAELLAPILLRGSREDLDAIRHISFDNEIFETDLQHRNELIGRILFGLDVNQTATKGSEDSNHWTAWATSDEERRIAVQPDLERFCWAATRLILHAELAKTDMPPERVLRHRVGFDLTASAVRTNQQEDARQMWDRGAISNQTMRRVTGFSETDVMSDLEYARYVGIKLQDPYLALLGLVDKLDIDLTKIKTAKPGPAPESQGDEPNSGPGVGDPGSPDDNDSDVPRTDRPA